MTFFKILFILQQNARRNFEVFESNIPVLQEQQSKTQMRRFC